MKKSMGSDPIDFEFSYLKARNLPESILFISKVANGNLFRSRPFDFLTGLFLQLP